MWSPVDTSRTWVLLAASRAIFTAASSFDTRAIRTLTVAAGVAPENLTVFQYPTTTSSVYTSTCAGCRSVAGALTWLRGTFLVRVVSCPAVRHVSEAASRIHASAGSRVGSLRTNV